MSSLGSPPERSELARAVDRALDERLAYADWPEVLKRTHTEASIDEDRSAFRFQQIIGLFVTLLSSSIDLWSIPEQAAKGFVLRLVLIVPVALALIIWSNRIKIAYLRIGTAFTLAAFGGIVTHLASYADLATATRYTMATSFLLGMGILMLPFRRFELAGFAALFIAVNIAAAFWPNPLPSMLVVEHLLVTSLVAGGTLAFAVRMNDLRLRNFLLNLRDTSNTLELQERNQTLRQLSEIDALTGLANRRAFTNFFNAQLRTAKNDAQQEVSLMMIDLDHFKRLNDTHGHQAGDRALRHIARYLQSTFEDVDGMVARFGGEEFVAVLRCDSIGKAEELAEEIREGIGRLEIPTRDNERLRVTTSIGLASSGVGAVVDLSKLTARADRALYAAKEKGRDQVVLSERIELRVDRLPS